MSLEDFQLLHNEPIDNSIVKGDFVKGRSTIESIRSND